MRILLVQRSLNPPGGGNAVAAWMLHALAGGHEVATMTASRWDVARTNAFYGTSIPGGRVQQFVVPANQFTLGHHVRGLVLLDDTTNPARYFSGSGKAKVN